MLAANSFYYGIFLIQPESKHGNIVFHTHRRGGGIHRLYTVIYNIYIADMVVFFGFGIEFGVAVVNTVYIFSHQQQICLNLASPLRGGGIGRAVRIASSASHNNNPALFKMVQNLS